MELARLVGAHLGSSEPILDRDLRSGIGDIWRSRIVISEDVHERSSDRRSLAPANTDRHLALGMPGSKTPKWSNIRIMMRAKLAGYYVDAPGANVQPQADAARGAYVQPQADAAAGAPDAPDPQYCQDCGEIRSPECTSWRCILHCRDGACPAHWESLSDPEIDKLVSTCIPNATVSLFPLYPSSWCACVVDFVSQRFSVLCKT